VAGARPRTITTGIVLRLVLGILALLFFVQTDEPLSMMSVSGPITTVWILVTLVHVLLHGFPVRVTRESRGRTSGKKGRADVGWKKSRRAGGRPRPGRPYGVFTLQNTQ
jgi:hypothetical protein